MNSKGYNPQAWHGKYHAGAMALKKRRKQEEAVARGKRTRLERTAAWRRTQIWNEDRMAYLNEGRMALYR